MPPHVLPLGMCKYPSTNNIATVVRLLRVCELYCHMSYAVNPFFHIIFVDVVKLVYITTGSKYAVGVVNGAWLQAIRQQFQWAEP